MKIDLGQLATSSDHNLNICSPSPKGEHVSTEAKWKTYRTRFLIKAKQLTEPLVFVDGLGREHRGKPGDYLVESSDGCRSIQRREIFEDVYVPIRSAARTARSCLLPVQALTGSKSRISTRSGALA